VRDSDRLIRWGGEEFLLISRDADRTRGDVLAGRVMASVGSEPFDLGGGHKVRRTCSVGWAPFPWFPDSARTFAFTEVLKIADRAMYLAKQAGRNRSVGVVPCGTYAQIGSRNGEWWEKPLTECEGKADHSYRPVRDRRTRTMARLDRFSLRMARISSRRLKVARASLGDVPVLCTPRKVPTDKAA
jgi:predicted signal transduction protein with EAL and GGDEF domain